MPTKRILIVEDEALLYRKVRNLLENHHFEVDEYTKSVNEALTRIQTRRPDLVLLDIYLEGDQTGIDLGKILRDRYDIPFIYLTQYDDERTFAMAFGTEMEDFLVKSKPVLDGKELVRKIMMVFQKKETQASPAISDSYHGITAFTDYLKNLKHSSKGKITEIKLPFRDIVMFTTDINLLKKKKIYKPNYIFVITRDGNTYFLPGHLTHLCKNLPDYFARIGDGYVLNILSPLFKGRINGKLVRVMNKDLKVSPLYRQTFEEKFHKYFLNGRMAGNDK